MEVNRIEVECCLECSKKDTSGVEIKIGNSGFSSVFRLCDSCYDDLCRPGNDGNHRDVVKEYYINYEVNKSILERDQFRNFMRDTISRGIQASMDIHKVSEDNPDVFLVRESDPNTDEFFEKYDTYGESILDSLFDNATTRVYLVRRSSIPLAPYRRKVR